MLPKCVLYLVNGINLPLYGVIKHGNVFRGFKDPKGKSKPTIVKSSEVNSFGGYYEELQLTSHLISHRGYTI